MNRIDKTLINRPRVIVGFHFNPRRSLHGRFGGGWQWKLGIQAGGRTLILNLLVAYVRIYLVED